MNDGFDAENESGRITTVEKEEQERKREEGEGGQARTRRTVGDARNTSRAERNRGGEKLARFVSADGSPIEHRGDRLIRTNGRLSAKKRNAS